MKRNVKVAFLIEPITAPGALSGDVSLSPEKFKGIEMMTGEEPGFLTIHYQGLKIGTPITNCRSLVWEADSFT